MTTGEVLARELIALVRRLRELGATTGGPAGQRLDLAAAAVLGTVGDAGPLRLSELAERLGLDVSTVSRQVPALERQGLVVREADPCDRRATLLRLSPEGRTTLAARRATYAELLVRALPGWTDAELQRLATDLARLNADLSAARTTDLPPVPVPQEVS